MMQPINFQVKNRYQTNTINTQNQPANDNNIKFKGVNNYAIDSASEISTQNITTLPNETIKEEKKKELKGSEALANYNKAFISVPNFQASIKKEDSKENKDDNKIIKEIKNNYLNTKVKPIEIDAPSFKAEEGIENLEAKINK